MKKYTAKELVNEGYTLENALIKNVSLSSTDYCCLTLNMDLEGGGWGCSYGGYCLGKIYPNSYEKDTYEGSAAGMEAIMRIMELVCRAWRTCKANMFVSPPRAGAALLKSSAILSATAGLIMKLSSQMKRRNPSELLHRRPALFPSEHYPV